MFILNDLIYTFNGRNAQGSRTVPRYLLAVRARIEDGESRTYKTNLNLKVKVLDFVKFGGPKWIVGGTIFEMWLGAL